MPYLTNEDVLAATLGGAYLGGGGGGWLAEGRRMGELAVKMGRPRLITVAEVDTSDTVVTVSSVGAPASLETYVEPADYVKAIELLIKATGVRPAALITNENGGAATINGWLQGACLGLPVLDAPCNGRAHPTGVMGAMGLHRDKSYISTQVAVGGDADRGRRVELTARGGLEPAASLVRQAAVQAGGLVAVARNPVTAGYARANGAVGAISQAIALGRKALAAGPETRASDVANHLGGQIRARGWVRSVELVTAGGFDAGTVLVEDPETGMYELTFWNEFMTMNDRDLRLGTFPDLIMTLDSEGLPLTSAEIREGMPVQVLLVPGSNLILGAGMRDPQLFAPVEKAIGKSVISYAFPG